MLSLSKSAAIIAALAFLLLGLFFGYELATRGFIGSAVADTSGQPADVDFSPVWKAWSVINEKFVPASVATTSPLATSTEKLNQQKVYGMIGGLAASLTDPYTFFLPPVENKEFASDMKGSFEGVGMEIEVKDQVLTVVSPLPGSPAEAAGLKSGDKILKIDGKSTVGIDTSQAVNEIRGPKGTKVILTVLREGWTDAKEIPVTRDVINVPIVVSKKLAGGIYQIHLTTFTENSPALFRAALREFLLSGDHKLILDLRGNPGGYLDAAVDIGSWFLPQGAVIVTEDYAGHDTNIVHRSYGYNIFHGDVQVVVLVDKGSASASEILADALRYHGVAKLVGTNTFGKGSVQELVEITPETALKLTVARWLGPDSIQIPREGIVPDYHVDLKDADLKAKKDPQLDKAIELLGGPKAATTTTAH
jgi:carboxyl-terminal processing protease